MTPSRLLGYFKMETSFGLRVQQVKKKNTLKVKNWYARENGKYEQEF